VDEDLAFMTRLAGELAYKAGQEGRARKVLNLTLSLYEQMEEPTLAEEVREILQDL
jgi:hypothetical protein